MILRPYDPLADRRVGRPWVHAPRPVGRGVSFVRWFEVSSSSSFSGVHLATSARFRAGPPGSVSGRLLRDDQQEGADRPVVISRCLTCPAAGVKCRSGLLVCPGRGAGGACARWVERIVCARAPSLTSVHDPRVGFGVGDKMFDGVIPLGEALRPLNLSRPSTRTCRQQR